MKIKNISVAVVLLIIGGGTGGMYAEVTGLTAAQQGRGVRGKQSEMGEAKFYMIENTSGVPLRAYINEDSFSVSGCGFRGDRSKDGDGWFAIPATGGRRIGANCVVRRITFKAQPIASDNWIPVTEIAAQDDEGLIRYTTANPHVITITEDDVKPELNNLRRDISEARAIGAGQ